MVEPLELVKVEFGKLFVEVKAWLVTDVDELLLTVELLAGLVGLVELA